MKETMQDITIVCKDCGEEFIFTVGEQKFFKEKGLEHNPVRCKACRDKKRANNDRNNNPRFSDYSDNNSTDNNSSGNNNSDNYSENN